MMPTHAKKPAAMREMCAHGGPTHCNAGCYSKGGSIELAHGVNQPLAGEKGISLAGERLRGKEPEGAKRQHHKVLSELRADKHDRRNLAEGGAVGETADKTNESGHERGVHRKDRGPLENPMEHESDEPDMASMIAEELSTALEKKDHKGIAQAIEALVMNCMSKGGSDV